MLTSLTFEALNYRITDLQICPNYQRFRLARVAYGNI